MPEPFKNLFNRELIEAMASVLSRVSPEFETEAFIAHASQGLEELEMMARADQISAALDVGFTEDFLTNVEVLVRALHGHKTAELSDMRTDETGIAGWAIVPLASYVARHGMKTPEQSLDALREMTMRFSTEFAVRYFLRDHPEIALSKMRTWASDPNHHVRRLSSEGMRPLLPWGIKLHGFVNDPTPVLQILTVLRDDPSEYVRKSVANNLNDISKNHPDLVADIAVKWLKNATPQRERLIKQACRTLIKSGHVGALAAFGYGEPQLADVALTIPKSVRLGDMMPVEVSFRAKSEQRLLIDYVLHYMRANGKLSRKVFKWTEVVVQEGERRVLVKNHSYKKVTTRKDYAGVQAVSVQINGANFACEEFLFTL